MRNSWLAIIILFFPFPAAVMAQAEFTFGLSTDPAGYFIPGDEVRLDFSPGSLGSMINDSFTLAVELPAGLVLDDAFWTQQGSVALRTLPKPADEKGYPVGITTRIREDFKGRSLTVSGYLKAQPGRRDTVSFSVAEILASSLDTCFSIKDSSGGVVNTIVATRRVIKAKLRGPIDLSPTLPLRISHKGYKTYVLLSEKKRNKAKKKSTLLHFLLSESETLDYPSRKSPGKKKIKGQLDFVSGGRIGDSLLVSLKTIKGRPLRNISLIGPKDELLDALTDAPSYQFSAVQDTAFFHRTLHLRARRRFFGIFPVRQYCLVDAERRTAPVTLYRNNGPPLQQAKGDTTLLSRTIVSSNHDSVITKELVVHRSDKHTVFYQIVETEKENKAISPRRDTLSRDTCDGLYKVAFANSMVKSMVWEPVDTLLYQAVDASESVVGLRNPLGRQQGQIEIKVPVKLNAGDPDTRDSLIAIAYWVGIGTPPISAYEALAEEIPPEWAQPGVSPPLAAYGLGHPVILPSLGRSDALFQENSVKYDFVDAAEKTAFLTKGRYKPLFKRNTERPNFGTLRGTLRKLSGTIVNDPEAGKDVHRFYLTFANQHQINSYSIRLYVVAYYRVWALKEVWVKATPSP